MFDDTYLFFRYLNYDVVKMRKAKSMDGDHLPVDSTTTTHLEALWAEDNSRSAGFAVEAATPSTENSTFASDTNNSTAAITTLASPTNSSSTENPAKVRRRRSTKNCDEDQSDTFQDLETVIESKQSLPTQRPVYPNNMWSNTVCSKKVFCEAMLAQPEDSVAMMDKKIHTFLSL